MNKVEDILEKHIGHHIVMDSVEEQEIHNAMIEYGEIEAIEFGNWLIVNNYNSSRKELYNKFKQEQIKK